MFAIPSETAHSILRPGNLASLVLTQISREGFSTDIFFSDTKFTYNLGQNLPPAPGERNTFFLRRYLLPTTNSAE